MKGQHQNALTTFSQLPYSRCECKRNLFNSFVSSSGTQHWHSTHLNGGSAAPKLRMQSHQSTTAATKNNLEDLRLLDGNVFERQCSVSASKWSPILCKRTPRSYTNLTVALVRWGRPLFCNEKQTAWNQCIFGDVDFWRDKETQITELVLPRGFFSTEGNCNENYSSETFHLQPWSVAFLLLKTVFIPFWISLVACVLFPLGIKFWWIFVNLMQPTNSRSQNRTPFKGALS